jgi:hypothetical protein
MIEVDLIEKDKILSSFPSDIKLSYENIVHKKVLNPSLISVIPQGKKCLIWFTQKEDQQICYLLQFDFNKNNKDDKNNKNRFLKNISNIFIGKVQKLETFLRSIKLYFFDKTLQASSRILIRLNKIELD